MTPVSRTTLLMVFLLTVAGFQNLTSPVLNLDTQMQNLWTGQANFKPLVSLQIPTQSSATGKLSVNGMNQGTQIIASGGLWFLFNREYGYAPKPAACTYDFARVVVRSSADHGKTWSTEVVVAEPNLAAGECAIVDSHVYFDAENKTWHMLAQSLSSKQVWNINHYILKSEKPFARFTADASNPVIRSGDLWRNICASGKKCPKPTGSEGTPEISTKRNGYFYVTFHGAYAEKANSVRGYRGLAKTKDFHTWTVKDQELSGDPIWSSQDCQGWSVAWNKTSGCIGGGAASSLITEKYTYELVESSDISLTCEPGQNWVAGLVRSPTGFASTGNWQHRPGTPLMSPHSKNLCAIQYAKLFEDEGAIYLSYWSQGPSGPHDSQTSLHIAELSTQPLTVSVAPGKLQILSGASAAFGQFTLSYQTDGNVVLNDNFGFPVWNLGTSADCPRGSCALVFQTDGNLVLYQNGSAYWSSRTGRSEVTPFVAKSLKLALNEPYLSINDAAGDILWTGSGLFSELLVKAGHFVRRLSNSGLAVFLVMQTDGNLVIYSGSDPSRARSPLWWSGTSGKCKGSGCRAHFQADGNFVLYNGTAPYWTSQTDQPPGAAEHVTWFSLEPLAPYFNLLVNTGDSYFLKLRQDYGETE